MPLGTVSAPTSPKLSSADRDRERERVHGNAPKPTRAQAAYIHRLLAPIGPVELDPLAKLRNVNSGESLEANGSDKTGLEQSLEAFTSVEVLEGDNAFACKKCWKIKHGKYKPHHVNFDQDGLGEAGSSSTLPGSLVPSPPMLAPEPRNTSAFFEQFNPPLSSPDQGGGHIGRAPSIASRSSAGKIQRAPSPLRSHVEATSESALSLSSVKSNDIASIISGESAETAATGMTSLTSIVPDHPRPVIDDDSDGLSNSSSSGSDRPLTDSPLIGDPTRGLKERSEPHYIKRRAFKRYLIAQAPEILVFHFKRFKQTQKALLAFTNFYDLKKWVPGA